MAEFTLNRREEDTLKLNIGDESFQIPLATSLTLDEAATMDTMDGAVAFFKKYIRKELADTLTLMNWRDVINAWREASEKAVTLGEIKPGES